MTSPAVDWHRVFEDFAHLDVTGSALADRIGLPVGMLQRVATGKLKPAPRAADRIIGLWCDLTSKSAAFLPRCRLAGATLQPEVIGLDSETPIEGSFHELQSIAAAWAQMSGARRRT